MADHWLVRTKENFIAGPYTREQIKELVLSGKIGYQDEICQSNSYWIYLHERQEVKSLLGIEVPKPSKASSEEVTETETQTETILELESSIDAMPEEDSPRVGTMVARIKPASADRSRARLSKQQGSPTLSSASPVGTLSPIPADSSTPPPRPRTFLVVATAILMALIVFKYMTS